MVTLLEDVEKYFRAQAPMSEEKAVSTFTLIFGKVQREFPLITSIGNINKRLAKDLRDKIADVNCHKLRESRPKRNEKLLILNLLSRVLKEMRKISIKVTVNKINKISKLGLRRW